MSFHVGQKVVCIDDEFAPEWYRGDSTPNLPVKGECYTIRAILLWRSPDEVIVAVLLHEIRNPVWRWSDGDIGEHPFNERRFKPLDERKTDISVFTKMLTPKKVEEVV